MKSDWQSSGSLGPASHRAELRKGKAMRSFGQPA
jgi:hypothetical protein